MKPKNVRKNVQEVVRGKTKKKTIEEMSIEEMIAEKYPDDRAMSAAIKEMFARDEGYEAGKSEARNREMVNK